MATFESQERRMPKIDACLKADKNAHVACETTVGPDVVVNVGEITCKGFDKIDTEKIARRVCKKIGYDQPGEHFDAKDFWRQTGSPAAPVPPPGMLSARWPAPLSRLADTALSAPLLPVRHGRCFAA